MKNLKISTKLLIICLSIGIISTLSIGYISIQKSEEALTNETTSKLEALSGLRKVAIENVYKNCMKQIKAFSQTTDILDLAYDLEAYTEGNGISDQNRVIINSQEYKQIVDKHQFQIHNLTVSGGYYDLFIIDTDHGYVLYTDAQEGDLGDNLVTGRLRDSHLAWTWKETIKNGNIAISDLQPYAPSNNMPAQFIGYPVKDKHQNTLAVLILQIPDKIINTTMTNHLGLGKRGESYLVGSDHIMRSNSRFQENAILNTSVESKALLKALKGETGTEVTTDYQGVKVISSYDQIEVGGLNWAILTEIDESEAHAASNKLENYILFITIAIVFSIIVVTWFIARSIARPVETAAKFAEKIAKGDLTQTIDIKQKDEIGIMVNALKNMSLKLKQIVTEINSGAGNMATASGQISTSSQAMSEGANEQAASVEEISSTMEEISANIQQNADNALQTENISQMASKGIQTVSERSGQTLDANRKISDKITIITDIAFQTNILALNAAVEAARAGEQGRGFAVVAAEVRKLAERSKIAAEEIVTLTDNSLKLAEKAQQELIAILPEVDKTSRLVQEISAASTEQNNGATQVNNAIQQLNTLTQQNASSSEELASSSEELNGQAEQLKSLVSFFKIDNHIANIDIINQAQPNEPALHSNNEIHNKHQVKINMDKDESEKNFTLY